MKQTRIGAELVTPRDARKIIETEMYERQRPLRPGHVIELAHHMENGTFIENTNITFAVLDGQRHLINGQHTVHAIVKSKCSVTLNIQEYSCRNEAEMNSLYARQDKHYQRTEGDSFHSLGLVVKWELKKDLLYNLSAAAKVIGRGFGFSGGRNDVRFRDVEGFLIPLMDEWRPAFSKVLGWMKETPSDSRGFVCGSQVLPVILWIARYYEDQEKAREFVFELANDSGLHRLDPRRVLWDVHLSFKLDPFLKRNKYRHFNRYVAATWNAIESGKWSKTRKIDTERKARAIGDSMTINGTPKPSALPLDYFLTPQTSRSTAVKATKKTPVVKKVKKGSAKQVLATKKK